MSVKRIYVEKKEKFATDAKALLDDVQNNLQVAGVIKIRILHRYDIENISEETFNAAVPIVFSEPPVDNVFFKMPHLKPMIDKVLIISPLPGQFDQRADSCEQCIRLMTGGGGVGGGTQEETEKETNELPTVRTATVYIFSGYIDDTEFEALRNYLINPVDSFETDDEPYDTLQEEFDVPEEVPVLENFINAAETELKKYLDEYSLAMDFADIKFTQDYFKKENRNPTLTEIRVIDTYWSDHCRHTTFLTHLESIDFDDAEIEETYRQYLAVREELGIKKPVCLMDLATIAAKKIIADGLMPDLDVSDEINACSVRVNVDVNGKEEPWLMMFKNETHNHPTEIEPFGGAATCLGGAIRDPLSGRSYVYQAMRITGAGNPLTPIEDTINGKLPQRKICLTAAEGYSSYGNQIGLATGFVNEIYHPGYVAKRMEIGAVIGAAPLENIRREKPAPGDVVVLLGGKTGRDGCGGATGSSKAHTSESLKVCGAEVQKGNPPEERKIQRIFRNPDVTKMVKRCNDFGAGGVSVAVGELADGLKINLDVVPKKYEGLDGTELAISESQERMAVVIAAEDVEKFIAEAHKENLLATVIAEVTENPRLQMFWNDKKIVDLTREFLDSNGAAKSTTVSVAKKLANLVPEENYTGLTDSYNLPNFVRDKKTSTLEEWVTLLSALNNCSQKGLVQRFDGTIGAGSVFVPYGGLYQTTPAQTMVAKFPVLNAETTTVSIMSYGFNPFISSDDPYKGAILAVVESVAKIVATGGLFRKTRLTFQEYFERMNSSESWGKPLSALLGAFKAQTELGIPAIGGKDSVSGTFENLNVPPTLVSFAVCQSELKYITANVFHTINSPVILVKPEYKKNGMPEWKSLIETFEYVEKLSESGRSKSVWAISSDGIAGGIAKMCFGNRIGFKFADKFDVFKQYYGGFIVELKGTPKENETVLGYTVFEKKLNTGDFEVDITTLENAWLGTLEPIYTSQPTEEIANPRLYKHSAGKRHFSPTKFAKPRVVIPVFPGTNCEYDTARAFELAGAAPEIIVLRNITEKDIADSVKIMEQAINSSQILMLPGGFSGGDEPDGSAKFIAAFFRNPALTEAVRDLLHTRKGLILGICNGFQALIKLGLVPYGDIVPLTENSPTLTFNTISHHQALYVRTVIASNKSPWLQLCLHGDIHTIPISHGEGRFVATADTINQLAAGHQIATQYIDLKSQPTYDIRYNPNGSYSAIEGITSPDGRVLGKMAHSERTGNGIGKNVSGFKNQPIFLSGVKYFS